MTTTATRHLRPLLQALLATGLGMAAFAARARDVRFQQVAEGVDVGTAVKSFDAGPFMPCFRS